MCLDSSMLSILCVDYGATTAIKIENCFATKLFPTVVYSHPHRPKEQTRDLTQSLCPVVLLIATFSSVQLGPFPLTAEMEEVAQRALMLDTPLRP